MTNILKAIMNIVKEPTNEVTVFYETHNRATNMGKALEEFVKDMFAGTKHVTNEQQRLIKLNEIFSYLGNANNPPDIMIRGGNGFDAIEVKKIENEKNSIALNSSYPKNKLFSSSEMLTESCRSCEEWTERDIIYCVGVVNELSVEKITMVYGLDYAACSSTYERIKERISNGITQIDDVEFAETKELGKVNKVDPLGITNLRIRGMWHIDNPLRVFEYVYEKPQRKADFELICIINNDKFNSFPKDDHIAFNELMIEVEGLSIRDIKIKDPNNPVNLKDAKLILYRRGVHNESN